MPASTSPLPPLRRPELGAPSAAPRRPAKRYAYKTASTTVQPSRLANSDADPEGFSFISPIPSPVRRENSPTCGVMLARAPALSGLMSPCMQLSASASNSTGMLLRMLRSPLDYRARSQKKQSCPAHAQKQSGRAGRRTLHRLERLPGQRQAVGAVGQRQKYALAHLRRAGRDHALGRGKPRYADPAAQRRRNRERPPRRDRARSRKRRSACRMYLYCRARRVRTHKRVGKSKVGYSGEHFTAFLGDKPLDKVGLFVCMCPAVVLNARID